MTFDEIEETQCPECRFEKRCPAKKVLHVYPNDQMVMSSIMRKGFCSQYEQKPKKAKEKEGSGNGR